MIMKLTYLLKSIPALFADMANGVFAVHIAALAIPTEILWWHYLVGVALAMCPDLDALPELFTRGKLAASASYQHDHRELLHIPAMFLVIGVVLWLGFGYWGLLFLVATMLHFINDLYGTGWGVPLLRPLTRDRFKLFTDQQNELSFHYRAWLRRIQADQLSVEITEYGNENWIDDYYWNFSVIALIEYTLFAIAVTLVLFTLL